MEQQVVLITGAGRGIGAACALLAAERGYAVCVNYRSNGEAAAQVVADIIAAGGSALAVQADVADEADIVRLFARVDAHFGRLDALVNNAAILYDTWQQAVTADLATVQEALDTNLLGAWRAVEALLPALRRSPHPRIVNVSSEAGSLASMNGGAPAYRVSKAALNALTRTLASELRRDRVLVNAICPGWVATDMGGAGGRPVEEGAAGVVWAATLPDDGPTGGFFRDAQPVPW
jgi:NAD(P)-dependent dehydrogenase (short-subunit alcohol dehydrogenase family)